MIVAAGNPPQDGLKPGEMVVTRGALILMQMYDDAATVESGAPRMRYQRTLQGASSPGNSTSSGGRCSARSDAVR